VNITLVTTSTWPADGPLRLGRDGAGVAEAAVSDGLEGSSGAAISGLFRETRAGLANKLLITTELERDRQGGVLCQAPRAMSGYAAKRRAKIRGQRCEGQKNDVQ